jgi:RHS repeat-associated protein
MAITLCAAPSPAKKQDGTGLLYYNARYYDPALGTFISPDTLVPDPGLVFDYNRYMYVRGNPLRYTDPSGHIPHQEVCKYFGSCTYESFVDKVGQELADLLWDTDVTWGDKLEWGESNVAMLILMDSGQGRHHGVLWGIQGTTVGGPISLQSFRNAGHQGFDRTAKAAHVKTIWDLPMSTTWRWNGWYRTRYVDISEVGLISGPVLGVAGKLLQLSSKLKYIPAVIPWVGDGVDAMLDMNIEDWAKAAWPEQSALIDHAAYYWPRTFGDFAVTYPVMRFAPHGSTSWTFHLLGPGGIK